MLYRNLGNSGLKVSVLSFGNWITGHSKQAELVQKECVKVAWKNGINFFDTAEVYGFGVAEEIMGEALKELEVDRSELVVSTKLFWFKNDGNVINMKGLSRKHVVEGMRNSLKRLQLSYVDVVFCHRPDYETPLEEVCRAMSYLIDQGHAFYWGTSEWPPCMLAAAMEMCKRLNLHQPIVEQCQYNMIDREKMEDQYRYLFSTYNLGTTIWSPLKSGLLTGKYNSGNLLEDSRLKEDSQVWKEWIADGTKREELVKKLNTLQDIAKELGATLPQLALAWTVAYNNTTTCILGASKVSQLEENLKALDLLKKWTPELEARIEEVLGNRPRDWKDCRTWKPLKPARLQNLYQPPKEE